VGDATRLRLTTNDNPDTIDASGTATPFDASVPEVFDTKGGGDVLIGKGGDAGRARAGGRLSFESLAFPDGSTKATKLLVRDLSAGGRAELRCKGPGCRGPAKRTGKRGKGGAVNLRKLIQHRLPGASG
jgi:hypothetical protein